MICRTHLIVMSLLITENTPFAMLMEDNEAPPPNHITMIIGGGTKESLELAFGLALMLKLTRGFGKAKNLRSLTYLQPSEYSSQPNM